MKRFFKTTIFILLSGLSIQSSAQGPISIGSTVDKSRITIGDVITYSVHIAYNEDVDIFLPGQAANLGGFEIRGYEEHRPKKADGQVQLQLDYQISTFMTGEFDIPPLPVGYQLPGDTLQQILESESIHIVVESVKPSEEGDIIDIKPPESIPLSWWYYGRWAVLGLGVLLMAGAAWYVYRKRQKGEPIMGSREPQRPAHEIAIEALHKLQQSDLLEQGEIKTYYTELSDIMRRYCEGRYYVQAMEMITDDILRDLKAAGIEDENRDDFEVLFVESDMVKFAKAMPEQSLSQALLQRAVGLVQRTQIILELSADHADDADAEGNTSTELQSADAQKAIPGDDKEEMV